MSNKGNKLSKSIAGESETPLLLKRVTRLLEILVRSNLNSLRGNRSQTEMIVMLSSIGCAQAEIADLLGTTSNTVNVTLYNEKKKKKK
jgi:DNA-binding CsgD family transcriptional regulator